VGKLWVFLLLFFPLALALPRMRAACTGGGRLCTPEPVSSAVRADELAASSLGGDGGGAEVTCAPAVHGR